MKDSITSVFLIALVAVMVAIVGIGVVENSGVQEEWKENRHHFEQYCAERFGEDADVYIGGGQGVHSGLHCEDGHHEPVHLGAVEPLTWEAYKNGEASPADVTNSLRNVGFMGRVGGWKWKQYLGITFGIGAGVFAIGQAQRRRKSN